jgi:multisubunit Na+/H+ antiporter MnhB subunit
MRRLAALITLLILAGIFWNIARSPLLPYGQPAHSEADDYYLANGQAETGANNIVTAVVFDYRGFDTLGEATVLFVAVLGVGLIFRRLSGKEEGGGV